MSREEYETKIRYAEDSVIELLKENNEEVPLRTVLDTLTPPPVISPEVLSAALTNLYSRGLITLDQKRVVRLT